MSIVYFQQPDPPNLDDLQAIVGGWVTEISLSPTVSMFVNEEGICRGLVKNEEASVLAQQTIVGRVAVWDKTPKQENKN